MFYYLFMVLVMLLLINRNLALARKSITATERVEKLGVLVR